jgi:LacI family transcriptional regulator
MIQMRRIGLAIDAVGAYGRGIIRGVATFCRAHPHWLIVEEPQWSFAKRANLKTWEVDGVIAQVFDEAFENEILAAKIPATNVSNFCESHRLPTVLPDDAAVGTMAAQYLASFGLRDFGFVWSGGSEFGRLRLEAFRNYLIEHNLTMHECNVKTHDMGQWLIDLPKPAAVLGCNDEWAHRLLKAARRVDVKVPDQVAVLGVDDDELINTLISPSLSSISLPAEQIGYEAAAQLEKVLNGEKVPETTKFAPLRVVTRRSTEVMFIDDPDVTLALRFIHEHASQPLRVDDLLEHVPLSRRSVERRFREALGRSISEEIRHVHVERAKQLLITTDLPIKQIATSSGFENATRMGIVFQKEVGESPTAFRWRSRMGGRSRVVEHEGEGAHAKADSSAKGSTSASAASPPIPAIPSHKNTPR